VRINAIADRFELGDGNITMIKNILTVIIASEQITIMATVAIPDIVRRLEWERIAVNEFHQQGINDFIDLVGVHSTLECGVQKIQKRVKNAFPQLWWGLTISLIECVSTVGERRKMSEFRTENVHSKFFVKKSEITNRLCGVLRCCDGHEGCDLVV